MTNQDGFGFITRAITRPNAKGGRSFDPWFLIGVVMFTILTLNPVTGAIIPIGIFCFCQWLSENRTSQHNDKPDYSTKALPKPRPRVTRNDR